MISVNLLGIGSPWQWDRTAWMVLKAMQYNKNCQRLISQQRLTITLLDRPHLQLLEHFQFEKVNIIIDAILLDSPFGTTIKTKVDPTFIAELENSSLPQYSSHGINLAQTLALGSALNKLPEHLYFLGFNIFNAEFCDQHLEKLHEFRQMIILETSPYELR